MFLAWDACSKNQEKKKAVHGLIPRKEKNKRKKKE
jgi:hypothetical protein